MKQLISPTGGIYIATGVMNVLVALLLLLYALFPAAIGIVAVASAAKEEEGALPAAVLMGLSTIGLGGGALIVGIIAIAYIACGVGLIRRRSWSRIFGVALAVPMLFACIPVGTVVGILAMVALLSKEGADEFLSA